MPFSPSKISTSPGGFCGKQTFEANSLLDFVEIFMKVPQHKFYARGEPCGYDTPWLPSIWRADHAFTNQASVTGTGSSFTQGELDALKQCQIDLQSGVVNDHYFQEFFKKIGDEISIESIDVLYWAALAQHYNYDPQNHQNRYPTRLLDVTTDIFVALYFAVLNNHDKDGFVAWTPIGGANNDLSQLPVTKITGSYFDVVSIKASDGCNYTPSDDTLNYIRLPFPNRRTEAQHGAFLWVRGSSQNYLRNDLLIRIPAANKPAILNDLKLINYDNDRLFPI